MRKLSSFIWFIVTIVSLFGAMVSVSPASASFVSSANDFPTTLQTSTRASHRVLFTTPSGALEGETITVTFSASFDTSTITEDDVDVADDSVDLTTAADCSGFEQASIAMAADVLTITICAGDGGAIAALSEVEIEIGTNATSSGTGANRILNPSGTGTYFVSVGGTFGDEGSIALPISSTDDTVSVSATIPAISSGGSGGAGAQDDSNAPSISDIIVSEQTESSVKISWSTNEGSDSTVEFGLTESLELGSISNSAFVFNHAMALSGLNKGATYFFRVRSKDEASNQASSSILTFSTLDLTEPQISDVTVVDITSTTARIVWNTDESATSIVEYGTNVSYGSSQSSLLFTNSHSVILMGLNKATQYHFRVRSSDAFQNGTVSADNVFTTLEDLPPANVSGLTIVPGDTQLSLSWTNPNESDLAGVRVVECIDTFPANEDDLTGCTRVFSGLASSLVRSGLINGNTYYYGVFAFDAAGQFASGAVGLDTPTASEEEVPIVEPICGPSEVPTEEPSGEIVCKKIGGSQPEPEPGSVEEEPTLLGAGKAKLTTDQLEFVVAGGNIVLSLGAKGIVDVLPNTKLRIEVSADEISDTVESLQTSIGSDVYLLHLADQQGGNALYFTDVITPNTPQLYVLQVWADYFDGSQETVSSYLNVLPLGDVYQVIDDEEMQLSGVKVTLSQVVNGSHIVWDGSPYDQYNPFITGSSGTYGWYVPNGTYRLTSEADHYLSSTSTEFLVDNFIVNRRVMMVAVPPLQEEESPTLTESMTQLVPTFSSVFDNILETPVTQTLQQAIGVIRENPIVQDAVDIATPTIVIAAGASVLVMVVAFDFLPFLQYLFTAPILLLWRRKRKGFGVVYDAVTRIPVDLAIVRLYLVDEHNQDDKGRLVKSRVTDKGGRFFFLVQPGTYRLTVTKAGFQFPTEYLKDSISDGEFLDVYHGESISVTEQDAVMTPNIPLDPTQLGETQLPKRVVWLRRLRHLQQGVGISGVLISIAIVIIRPSVLAAVMIGIQMIVYLIARRLAKPHKPKSWGIVYDKETNRPLSHVIARIFEPKYNKLLDTQVTDARGRYAFLLGPSEYFAVFEKPGYRSTHIRPIDLRSKSGSQDFAMDVDLHPSIDLKETR